MLLIQRSFPWALHVASSLMVSQILCLIDDLSWVYLFIFMNGQVNYIRRFIVKDTMEEVKAKMRGIDSLASDPAAPLVDGFLVGAVVGIVVCFLSLELEILICVVSVTKTGTTSSLARQQATPRVTRRATRIKKLDRFMVKIFRGWWRRRRRLWQDLFY